MTLEGKKTYVTAVMLGLASFALAMGWLTKDQYEVVIGLVGSLGLAALRSGVARPPVDRAKEAGPTQMVPAPETAQLAAVPGIAQMVPAPGPVQAVAGPGPVLTGTGSGTAQTISVPGVAQTIFVPGIAQAVAEPGPAQMVTNLAPLQTDGSWPWASAAGC